MRAQNVVAMIKAANGVHICQICVLQTYASMASAACIAIWTQKDKTTITRDSPNVILVTTIYRVSTVPVHHAKVTIIAIGGTPIVSMKGAPTYTHKTHAMTNSRADTVTAHHARLITNALENFASMARAAICKPLSLKLLLAWPQALSY